MADNVAITAGSGTSIATDDIGGVQYQRVKLSIGPDGTAVDASLAAPVPTRSGTFTTATAANVAVSASSNGTQLAASNSSRLGLRLVNRGTIDVIVVLTATGGAYASAVALTKLVAGEEFAFGVGVPLWTGVVHGIANGSAGSVDVTEFT